MNKRICFLMDRYVGPIAGTPSQVDKLMGGLQSRGWEVEMGVLRGSDYVDSDRCPVPIQVLGIESILAPGGYWKLFRLARRLKGKQIDLVHIYYNDCSLMVPPVMRLAGIRTIISRRDMGYWYTSTLKRLLSFTGMFVDGVICNCEAIKELTNQAEKIPRNKIHVIYNGYDINKALPKAALDLGTLGGPVIGIVANIRAIKRIEDAISAIAILLARGIPAHLHVIGGGDEWHCRAKVDEFGAHDHVHFHGNCENTPSIVEQLDIGVNCSESEGLSNAIIEYMLAGIPVVCTDTGGNAELIADGKQGLLVPVAEPALLADALQQLIEDPERAKRLGRAGQKKVSSMVAMDTMITKHESLYRNFISAENCEVKENIGKIT